MRTLSFLFIEDDEIEFIKFKKAFEKLGFKHHITLAKNGEEALQILNNTDNLPHLIILDLNMPKMDGLEFLRILKQNEYLKYIPAVIITTSKNNEDILATYNLGIAGYIIKPLSYNDYIKKIECLVHYWSINEMTV